MRLAMGSVLAALLAALALYQTQSVAQGSLAERTRRLREEIRTVPTSAANFTERIRLLEDWGGDLAARGVFHSPQMLMMAFYRNNDPATPAAQAAVKRWADTLTYLEENGGKMGTLRRVDSQRLIAGSYGTLVLEYTVGALPIPPGQGIRVGQSFIANRPRLQSTDPSMDNYVSFAVKSASAKVEPYASYGLGVWSSIFLPAPMPAVKVVSGTLRQGDTVRITIGDRAGGSYGYRPPPRDADEFKFVVECDFEGNGTFQTAAMTATQIYGDAATGVNLVTPSIVGVNEPFAVRLRVEDQYWNPASFAGGRFTVTLNKAAVGGIDVAAGKYTGRLDNVKIGQEGGYWFEVTSADGRLRGRSNPVLVEKTPARRLYWGELHGHSGWEEGTGSVPRYYEFARDVAYLDFASLTGHDLFLCKPGWDEIRRETEKANRDGQFVAYMGYEWTQLYTRGGHHNVIFKQDKGRYVQYREAPSPPELYAKLRAVDSVSNVLIIPHAHETGNWNFNDSEMEKLVEVFSFHGSFEYFGQRYLNRGYRTGFIAASDDHSGHPGYAPAGTATRGGLAAVYAGGLNRDAIWTGMKERTTYATTSARRPVMKVSMAGRQMGEEVEVGAAQAIEARVLGTAPIDRVEVVYNNQLAYSQDYLMAKAGEPAGVQVILHSLTETAGDDVRPPQSGVLWGGWIDVADGRIASIEPLGVDHYTDQFRQMGDRSVAFWAKTRGDMDGVLLKLAESSAKTRITVRVSTLEQDGPGTGGQRAVTVIPLLPSQTAKHTVSFAVDDVAAKRGVYDVTPATKIVARKTRLNAPWDVSFRYRPAAAAKKDDFFYVRMIQVDGEAAWSSPIWIGKK